MFTFTYTAYVLSLILVFLAVIIFLKQRPEQKSLSTFFLLHICADIIWIGSNAIADKVSTPNSLIFWSGMAYIGACFFISFYLCFVEVFVGGKPIKTWLMWLYISPSAISAFFAFSHYSVVQTIFLPGQPTQIVPGVLYQLFLPFLFLSTLYAAVRLILAYRRSSKQKRKQLLFIEAGFIMLFLGACIFDVVLPLKGNFNYYNVGPQFSLFFIILSAYAIFKYHLLDIRTVIRLGTVYAMLAAVVAGCYAGLVILFGLFLSYDGKISYLLAGGLTAVIAAFGAPALEDYLRRLTDRWFFKRPYDPALVVQQLGEVLNNNLELEVIIDKTSALLRNIFKIQEAEFLFFNPKTREFSQRQNAPGHPVSNITAWKELKILSEDQTPPAETAEDSDFFNWLAKDFRAEISLPIISGDKLQGLVLLGKKMSGDAYNQQDFAVLKTFALQAAMAADRITLYGEVKRHSLELENRVRERTSQLQGLQENQKQMMVDVSHALQTPLTVMRGEIGLLKLRLPKNSRKLAALEKTVEEVSKQTYSLLRLARLENQQEPFARTALDFSDLLKDAVEYLDILCRNKKIKLRDEIAPNVWVEGDAQKLEEVVVNLVSNAVKYIANKRIIKVTLVLKGQWAELSISDTGVGIPAEALPHIFERFYRVGNMETVKKGSGLGLSISKLIVEKHGGSIEAQSNLGVGSLFTVRLPAISAPHLSE